LIRWKVDHGPNRAVEFYPAEQFQKALYRPDVISRVLEEGSVAEAVLAANNALIAQKIEVPRGENAVDKLLPPGVTLTLVEVKENPRIKVMVTAQQGCPEQPIKSLALYVDGRKLSTGQGVVTFESGKEKTSYEQLWDVDLPPGKHKLVVIAKSKDDSPSVSNPIEIKSLQVLSDRPTLYHVAVGVSLYEHSKTIKNLTFAASDAEKLSEVFAAASTTGNYYKAVHGRKLLNAAATREKVLGAIQDVRDSAKTNDLFVLSFAGHGRRDDGDVFLLTHEADPTNNASLQTTAISGKVLRQSLTDFPCQVVVLLDSCHAGQIGALRSGSDDAARSLADVDTRATVICAALGHEEALARDRGGLFTMAVVRALQCESDTVYDHETGEMNVYDLMAYVYREVYKASEEKQTPYLKMPLAQPAITLVQFEKK